MFVCRKIGGWTIRRRTIRRGQFVADYSSHGQFVAGQFVARTIRRNSVNQLHDVSSL